MTQVRYTADGGHYRVGGVGFDPGDTREVDDDLAEYLADHPDFDMVGDAGGDDVGSGTETDETAGGVEPPFDPTEHTIDELEEELDTSEYGGSELHAVAAAEEDGKNRDGALEAIDVHILGTEEV
jgi:hypothetical protein